MEIINFLLHTNTYIGEFIQSYGALVYLLLFVIIFCETGLVFLPFLPGDSLLFAAGTFAGIGKLNFWILLIILILSAIIGDLVNYMIGKKFGEKIIHNKKIKLIKEEDIEKANGFIKKHGAKAIFFARFIPIIRTVVPFLVGIGKLEYKTFFKYNAIGAVAWVSICLSAGYFFGNIKFVENNISAIMLGIVFVSMLPIFIGAFKAKFNKNK